MFATILDASQRTILISFTLALLAMLARAQLPEWGEVPYNTNQACTYFSGEGGERCQGVWELANGNILVAGETRSRNFASFFTPLATPYQATHKDPGSGGNSQIATEFDAYIAIMDPYLTDVLYWTYLGGAGQDRAYFAMEDEAENIWVCGFTASYSGTNNFPSSSNQWYHPGNPASQGTADWDVFVAKLSADLSQLLDATVIGGSAGENCRGSMWVDSAQEFVYVSGATDSIDFHNNLGPDSTSSTVGTYSSCSATIGKCDAFLFQLDLEDASLNWSRLIVGNVDDNAWANVRVDDEGDVFIGGLTNSTSFDFTTGGSPTIANHGSTGDADGWIAKFNPSGSLLAMCRIGGTKWDAVGFNDCLELDGQDRPVVSGITRSTNFPLPSGCNPLNDSHSSSSTNTCDNTYNDIFVAKVSNDLQTQIYGTYVNKNPSASPVADAREEPAGLAVAAGNIYLTGETDSPGMPVTGNAFDDEISDEVGNCPSKGYHDSFVIKFFPGITGTSVLHYGSFFGGDTPTQSCSTAVGSEFGNRGRSLCVGNQGDNRGLVIFSGMTTMSDLPTTTNVLFPNLTSSNDLVGGFVGIHRID